MWKYKVFLTLFILFESSLAFGASRAEYLLISCVPKDVATSKVIGPVSSSESITFEIILPRRNQKEYKSREGQPMSHQELVEKYYPSMSDCQTLVGYLKSNGLPDLDTSKLPMFLGVEGKISIIEKVFHVNFYYYEAINGFKFRAPNREPSLNLNIPISEIHGFDDIGWVLDSGLVGGQHRDRPKLSPTEEPLLHK